jgi:hypothetical protein
MYLVSSFAPSMHAPLQSLYLRPSLHCVFVNATSFWLVELCGPSVCLTCQTSGKFSWGLPHPTTPFLSSPETLAEQALFQATV